MRLGGFPESLKIENMTNLNPSAVNATTDLQGQVKIGLPIQFQKRVSTPTFWKVLTKSRKVFEPQLTKNNAIKRQCIEKHISTFSNDTEKFWSKFVNEAETLLDSRKYLRECKHLGVPPVDVAEHIVFLGSSTINKVLKNGLYDTIGNDLRLYVERLTPESANVFRSKLEE